MQGPVRTGEQLLVQNGRVMEAENPSKFPLGFYSVRGCIGWTAMNTGFFPDKWGHYPIFSPVLVGLQFLKHWGSVSAKVAAER